MKLTEAARKILENRYLRRDEKGKLIETPEKMFRRVASAVAKTEKTTDLRAEWTEKFYQDMIDMVFLPNTPTLFNADPKGATGCLSACFQLTPEDDEEDILEKAKLMGMILKHGGGVGIALSKLRPEGSPIRSTHGRAHGPVLALREIYRAVPRMITQGGKRQAAMLANLDVHHPDIEKFITVKTDHLPSDSTDPGMSLYNISVSVDDEFMALETTEDLQLFDKMMTQAHKYGCPGLLFIDTVNKHNPYLVDFKDKNDRLYYWGTNPCAEQVLPNGGSCNLGSIDVSKFIKDGDLDLMRFRAAVKRAVRFLDNVVSINIFPAEELAQYSNWSRDIGLGIMGFADACAALGYVYGSDESIVLAEKIAANLYAAATEASEELGEEKGYAPAFDDRTLTDPITGQVMKKRRNVSLTTVAPTGSLSIFADCTGGIEPVFSLVELRRQGGIEYFYLPPVVRKYVKKDVLKELDTILKSEGKDNEKLREAQAIVELAIPPHIRTAHNVDWKEKIDVIAAFQRHIDRSISNTLNLPHDAPVSTVKEAAIYAWKQGLKGFTVYRDGSLPMQPYSSASTLSANGTPKNIKEARGEPTFYPVPDKCEGEIRRIKVDLGKGQTEWIYVMIGLIPGTRKPFQVFVVSRVEDLDPMVRQIITTTTRLVSTSLRAGAPLAEVIKQLERIEGQYIYSIPLKIATVLRDFLGDVTHINGDKCPQCGSPVKMVEGCAKCTDEINCGWSRCS